MVIRTFLSKCTTIFEGSKENFGLNPVIMLNKGLVNSRALVQFDVNAIKEKLEECNLSEVKHTLRMFNCGSLDDKHFMRRIQSEDENGEKLRAVSFDIIAFKIPMEWDRGRGFDTEDDKWFIGESAVSTQGCNWYQAKDGEYWEYEGIYSDKQVVVDAETEDEGPLPEFSEILGEHVTVQKEAIAESNTIYLIGEYDKYLKGESEVIVAAQHFEYGNEDLELDITSYVNSLISGEEKNYGLCICFSPTYDEHDKKLTRYVGFFTDKTNTFYEPIVESRYSDAIFDTRDSFALGKENKLYFYANAGGEMIDFDEMPVCTINDVEYPVFKQSHGVYYALVKLSSNDYASDMILTDEWSNLKLDGEDLEPVSQEFITSAYISFGTASKARQNQKNNLLVVISGIKNDEKLSQGDERILEVTAKIPYNGGNETITDRMCYRLYAKDAYREMTVIDWDDVNITPDMDYFTIDTSCLVPGEYHIDIKIGKRIHKDRLTFKVVSDAIHQRV
jgi:hypothetical protein